jgi:hypothetical protein
MAAQNKPIAIGRDNFNHSFLVAGKIRTSFQLYFDINFVSSPKQFLPPREGAWALARFNVLIALRGEAA